MDRLVFSHPHQLFFYTRVSAFAAKSSELACSGVSTAGTERILKAAGCHCSANCDGTGVSITSFPALTMKYFKKRPGERIVRVKSGTQVHMKHFDAVACSL